MKSTKWLTGIEVSESFEYGFWGDREWNQEGEVVTGSTISTVQRDGEEVVAGGIAYAGERGIRTVEASMDGGTTWQAATIESPLSDHTWVRWASRWTAPDRRERTFVVRAVDVTGSVQIRQRSVALPDGATGWHRVTKTV